MWRRIMSKSMSTVNFKTFQKFLWKFKFKWDRSWTWGESHWRALGNMHIAIQRGKCGRRDWWHQAKHVSRKRFCRILLVNQADIIKTVNKAMNVAFIIDGSDSITGRPNGGQWKQVKQWVWNVISALDLESRPAVSYVSVMQVRNFVFQLKNCQTSSHKV